MRAAIYNGPHDITVGERPDPRIQEPTDAVVRVTLGCVCGSDLWYWRGESPHDRGPIGHEFIGVVEEAGSEIRGLKRGDLVVAPFVFCDGTCPNCEAGVTSQCVHAYIPGSGGRDGGQGEAVRVPMASTSLVTVPGAGHSGETLRSLLALSDVMCTGQHAAVSAGVRPGSVVAVVGDGAVGLSAVIASKRLGAERIIALSRNPMRQALAREFGATDIVSERGDAAIEALKALTNGIGVDSSLECVGTGQALETAMAIARPGSVVGVVGAPHHMDFPVVDRIVYGNIGLRGGVAPARAYIPELLPDVLEGRINPGLVFDFETNLDGIVDAYEAMDTRRAIKSLIRMAA
ncbi:MAG TPA: alcohol dehydrogenase catalytic domain-containing protein [Candidatus Limnocylindrales bacterium]|nr:alcohol dehydrogenase catalytic domain-containing protein [Candidatus Limnocylindrales bacterium]